MAFAAQLGAVPPVGWAMFAMTIAWGVIYDTEYAMADRVDDLKIGVRSVAILLGDMDRLFVGALQILFVAALALIGQSVGRGAWFFLGAAIAALIFAYQQFSHPGQGFRAVLRGVPQQRDFRGLRVRRHPAGLPLRGIRACAVSTRSHPGLPGPRGCRVCDAFTSGAVEGHSLIIRMTTGPDVNVDRVTGVPLKVIIEPV